MKPGNKEIELENGTKVKVLRSSRPVSVEKFNRICQERNLTRSEIANEIGYASHSITGALSSGYMTGVMIKAIEHVFGIKYEEYAYVPEEKPVEKPEEKAEEKPVQHGMMPEAALYDTVKLAVTDAINEALSGNMKNLRGMIYTAIYCAINAAKKDAQ